MGWFSKALVGMGLWQSRKALYYAASAAGTAAGWWWWYKDKRRARADHHNVPGSSRSVATIVAESGASMIQAHSPVSGLDLHLCGFHPAKDNPAFQMEAHHYCHHLNEDFCQCAIFDSDRSDAKLVGIEYIISEKLFDGLPEGERKYWHPHNYEVLSGQLVVPRAMAAIDKKLMSKKINSYGKTWHVWMCGGRDTSKVGDTHSAGGELPYGPPMLMWSFNHDGEVDPSMVEERDRRMGISTKDVAANRSELAHFAHVQQGIDALVGKFPGEPRASIPGAKKASA